MSATSQPAFDSSVYDPAAAGQVDALVSAGQQRPDLVDAGNPDQEGRTPLFVAAENGHADAVAALHRLGSKELDQPTVIKVGGIERTPMLIAAAKGHVAVVETIARLCPAALDRPNNNAATPMYIAAYSGHVAVIETLHRLGSTALDQPLNDGCTPIYIAAYNGHVAVIETLHRLGSTALDRPKNDGATPMYIAACNGHVAVVETLVRCGSQALNTPKNSGHTPLMVAAVHKRVDTVRVLLRMGADRTASASQLGREARSFAKSDQIRQLFDTIPIGCTDWWRAELQRQRQELAEQREEANRQLAEQREETARVRQEANRQLAEQREETNRQLAELREENDRLRRAAETGDRSGADEQIEMLSEQLAQARVRLDEVAERRIVAGSLQVVRGAESMLGRGANGAVFRGTLQVAAKVSFMPGTLQQMGIGPADGQYRQITEELDEEVRTLSRLQHGNLVSMIGATYDQHGTVEYIVTELGERSLEAAISEGGVQRGYCGGDVAALVRLCRDVLSGLSYMHRMRTLHRDIKPANVLLFGDGTAKLCDVGAAKRFTVESATATLIGSMLWRAPEITLLDNGQPSQYSYKVDVYGFGVTLAQIVGCELPPDDKVARSGWAAAKARGHVLEPLIVACSAYDPAARPTSAEALNMLNRLVSPLP